LAGGERTSNIYTSRLERRAEHVCSARVFQTSTCSAMARASSTSMPRYLTVLSILVCPSGFFGLSALLSQHVEWACRGTTPIIDFAMGVRCDEFAFHHRDALRCGGGRIPALSGMGQQTWTPLRTV